MADKKSAAAEPAHEEEVYVAEAAAPVAPAAGLDPTKLNTLSVVSLATAATGFGAVAGVVTGHFALSQIRRSGEKGRGLALAGLIAGYAGVAGFALMGALAVGGHWAQNRFDNDHRGVYGNVQVEGGGNFGGMMGGRLDDQGQLGQQGQLGLPGQQGQGQGIQGGTITLDSNGNATITGPDGTTITLPDGGMMGGKGMFGPRGFDGQGGQQGQVAPVPTAVPQTN